MKGASRLGAALFSVGEDQLAIVVYVPDELRDTIDIGDWAGAIFAAAKASILDDDVGHPNVRRAVTPQSVEKGIFPFKLRDEAIAASFSFLRKKNIIVDNSDDEVDYTGMQSAAGIEW